MGMTSASSGGDFLARRNELAHLSKRLPKLNDVLIIEDEQFDADRLRATLRLVLGYDVGMRRASTVGSALDAVMSKQPELIFLDDLLKPTDTASITIPFLRRANYQGPLVVVSGQVTRARRLELIGLGATDVIHKDDVDSVRLAEALARVFNIT
jgi:DNA-binding NarL/FixJ family response regulator